MSTHQFFDDFVFGRFAIRPAGQRAFSFAGCLRRIRNGLHSVDHFKQLAVAAAVASPKTQEHRGEAGGTEDKTSIEV